MGGKVAVLMCFALVTGWAHCISAGEIILQCDAGEGVLQAGWAQVVAAGRVFLLLVRRLPKV